MPQELANADLRFSSFWKEEYPKGEVVGITSSFPFTSKLNKI